MSNVCLLQTLRPAIFNVVKLCLGARQLEMYEIDDKICYTLDAFMENQRAQLSRVRFNKPRETTVQIAGLKTAISPDKYLGLKHWLIK